jgi:threonine dehydrogenase-like Zn-dependent dehydrogenase
MSASRRSAWRRTPRVRSTATNSSSSRGGFSRLTDRMPLRQAIIACRKGGTVFAFGVFVGLVDKFPMGALINKGLTLRGAQQHGERYIPMLLERMAAGELKTAHLMTHPMPLDEGPRGYDYFKNKKDGCVRVVFQP